MQTIEAKVRSATIGVMGSIPKFLDYETFVTVAVSSIENTQGLLQCTEASMDKALRQCCMDGLLPNGKEAYIGKVSVNRGSRDKPVWSNEAQYIAMIDGVIKAVIKSGMTNKVIAKQLYENDKFEYGITVDGETFEYIPSLKERGKMAGAFAAIKLQSGETCVEYMSAEDIETVRSCSKSKDSGPWAKFRPQMACKSVLHRLLRKVKDGAKFLSMLESGMDMEFAPETKDFKPTYPKERFDSFLPTWTGLIQNGRRTAKEIIDLIEKTEQLTDEQLTILKGIK
jgi:recombination protein RecT